MAGSWVLDFVVEGAAIGEGLEEGEVSDVHAAVLVDDWIVFEDHDNAGGNR